jgi:cell division protein FtsL
MVEIDIHITTYFVFWFFIIFLLLFQCARVTIINKERQFQKEEQEILERKRQSNIEFDELGL